MKIIIGARGSGKTYSLVELVKNDPQGILVVRDEGLRKYLTEQYGLNYGQTVSYENNLELVTAIRRKHTYLDCIDTYGEIDDVFQKYSTVKAIAMMPPW